MSIDELIRRVEGASEFGNNALDVQIEIALFKPDGMELAVRSNAAGTKVIYTDALDGEFTYWPRDWTMERNREETLAALRALASKPAEEN